MTSQITWLEVVVLLVWPVRLFPELQAGHLLNYKAIPHHKVTPQIRNFYSHQIHSAFKWMSGLIHVSQSSSPSLNTPFAKTTLANTGLLSLQASPIFIVAA